ncbi:MAG: class I SAM-dependent methyltransferase [Patescibacteria group bacterium]
MADSEQINRDFYNTIGPDILASRSRPDWDKATANIIKAMLTPHADVLDVGCGYGRIAILLAKDGYHVTGIDLSKKLIERARITVRKEKLSSIFDLGSMTQLPYSENSFDAAICLWSAFSELLGGTEQRQALREMFRVIRPNGFALVESMTYQPASEAEITSGTRSGPEGRISNDVVEGQSNPHFLHDEKSYERLCKVAGIKNWRVFCRDWAGRPRLILEFRK